MSPAAGTEIVVVTIPEAMGVVEMKRVLQALRRFKIACRQIVINMVTPPDDCSFCSRKRDEEQGYVREVIAQCPDLRVGCVPRLPRPVRGLRNLLEFRRILYSTKAGDNSVPFKSHSCPNYVPSQAKNPCSMEWPWRNYNTINGIRKHYFEIMVWHGYCL